MGDGGRRSARQGATAIAAAAVCGAGVAFAGPTIEPLQPEQSRITVLRQTHDSTTARCKGGTEVVSGGFAAPDRAYAGGGPYTEILAATRRSGDRFVVKADNFSFSRGSLYAYAYCGHIGRVHVAEARKPGIEDFQSGAATARCPDGLTAVSGGWYGAAARGRPQFVPYVSKRAGTDGWKVAAENLALKGSATLVAQAYCADVEAPELEVNDVRMPGFNQLTAGVNCDAGQEAIAGGFDAATPHGYPVGAEVYSSRRKRGGDRWRVAAINGRDPRPLHVYAYCA